MRPLVVAALPVVVGALLGCSAELPEGFVYVQEEIATVQLDMRYYGADNFVGERIEGYEAPVAILSAEAVAALQVAVADLAGQGYYVRIFDAYRPQRAVDHFVVWSLDPEDVRMKDQFYPDLDKPALFEQGYIAAKSGHSRGSVVDLTLVRRDTGEELDMGSGFDFFGEISNHGTRLITAEQESNRNILRDAMVAAGFEIYPEEWWHYKLADEPFPDTYFDFVVR